MKKIILFILIYCLFSPILFSCANASNNEVSNDNDEIDIETVKRNEINTKEMLSNSDENIAAQTEDETYTPEPLTPRVDDDSVISMEYSIITPDEAQEFPKQRYPDSIEINYLGEDTIIYSNQFEFLCYMFEVILPDETVFCAVTKERGKERWILFYNKDDVWWAPGGARAREEE